MKVQVDEVEQKSFFIVSNWNLVDFVKAIRSILSLKNTVAILSEPEPEKEEASEYRTLANWISKMGIQHYRIRVSGHYYPYEIQKMRTIIKPTKILCIHTEHPEFTKYLWEKQ